MLTVNTDFLTLLSVTWSRSRSGVSLTMAKSLLLAFAIGVSVVQVVSAIIFFRTEADSEKKNTQLLVTNEGTAILDAPINFYATVKNPARPEYFISWQENGPYERDNLQYLNDKNNFTSNWTLLYPSKDGYDGEFEITVIIYYMSFGIGVKVDTQLSHFTITRNFVGNLEVLQEGTQLTDPFIVSTNRETELKANFHDPSKYLATADTVIYSWYNNEGFIENTTCPILKQTLWKEGMYYYNVTISALFNSSSVKTGTLDANITAKAKGSDSETDEIVWSSIASQGTMRDRRRIMAHLQHHIEDYITTNYPNNVTVQFRASLLSMMIRDESPRQNLVQTSVLIRKQWTDLRLQWDASEFGGHGLISLPSSSVWKPDIRLLNSAAFPSVNECADTNVLLTSDGQVLWTAQCQYVVQCEVVGDRKEKKKCTLVFGSWLSSTAGTSMDLRLYNSTPDLDLTLWNSSPGIKLIESKAVRVEKMDHLHSEVLPVKIVFEIQFQ